jgi:hypothetical protein
MIIYLVWKEKTDWGYDMTRVSAMADTKEDGYVLPDG